MPPPNFDSVSLEIVSGTNSISVANVFSISMGGSNDFSFAKFSKADTNFPPFVATNYHLCTIAYDATAIGGTLHFVVSGLATSWSVASHPDGQDSVFTQRDGFRLTGGIGEGEDRDGIPFLLTGATMTASGSSERSCDCDFTGGNTGGITIGFGESAPPPDSPPFPFDSPQ